MYKACGHFLIIKLERVETESVTEAGIVVPKGTDGKNQEQAGMSLAEVVDIGPNCWAGYYDRAGGSEPWCKKGDQVMIAKYGGQGFPVPDDATIEEKAELSLLRLIKDDDILARVQ